MPPKKSPKTKSPKNTSSSFDPDFFFEQAGMSSGNAEKHAREATRAALLGQHYFHMQQHY